MELEINLYTFKFKGSVMWFPLPLPNILIPLKKNEDYVNTLIFVYVWLFFKLLRISNVSL